MLRLLRWPAIIASFVLVLAALFFAVPAQSEENKNIQQTKYDVYAGGIHALEAKMINDLSVKGRYSVDVTAKTYGLLGKLAPWEGSFSSEGWRSKDGYQPQKHESVAIWRGEKEVKTYSYNKSGSFNTYKVIEDGKDKSPKELDKKLTDGTTDILSAALATMTNIARGEECSGTTEIFDGKRRYKLIFKQKDEVMLEKSRWNMYEGPAVQCTVLVEPVAGKWHEKPRGWASIQEQGRKKGTLPTVWFAQVKPNTPAIPVKVRIKTDYGTLFMHLTAHN